MDARELDDLLRAAEDEHLEFKEAKTSFDYEKLVKYCCALANEGGGKIVLGVTDKRPRHIVGSQAFRDPDGTAAGVTKRLRLRIHPEELELTEGRVLIFHVPARHAGTPVDDKGTYWMRSCDELLPMPAERLKTIFAETQLLDFSAQPCVDAGMGDLSSDAIDYFVKRWRPQGSQSVGQVLEDAELLLDGKPTYAGLILLGTHRGLGRHLPQAEIVFEYRSDEASIPYQQREEFREGFLLCFDRIWSLIHQRNDIHHIWEGLFRREIRTFNETVVREALLNAVSHRDYRNAGSVFIRQWPRRITFVSPGGFPPGISVENLIYRQAPRNRRIADALQRCGLVERSGQGADRMFNLTVREGKPSPDFTGSDEYQVSLTLDGVVQDERLIQFFESVTAETGYIFRVDDLIAIDAIARSKPIPDQVRGRLDSLLDIGAVQRVGRGRFDLAHRFYRLVDDRAASTRRQGLDRATLKALLLKHIRDNAAEGSPFDELTRVLPALGPEEVRSLVRELKASGEVHTVGRTRSARYFPGAASSI